MEILTLFYVLSSCNDLDLTSQATLLLVSFRLLIEPVTSEYVEPVTRSIVNIIKVIILDVRTLFEFC